ncbi:MAG TPA: UDP-N-acetylmuramoyl-L-alanine--D-glutamate ligase [Acidobacteriota bacterium]|nr:UDP-N-acetylmuramoyl-L-alanine--D-glutamate ligase [Acidobacteriota bacterium]
MTAEERINGRKIGVVGMARSGMAVARLALKHGASVFVSDAAPPAGLTGQTDELSRAGIEFETGGHTERLLSRDYLVLSPGVPLTVEILRAAAERGIPFFSELEFASWLYRGSIIGVTGSNGKTTTASLLGEILAADGRDVRVCGNIGLPFAEVVEALTESSVAVVEVSTFQLETIADFHPHVAVILNLTPDHLDRHGTFETYKRIKYRITENQTADDYFVLNRDDAESMADDPPSRASRLYFSTGRRDGVAAFVDNGTLYVQVSDAPAAVVRCDEIRIPGPHNLQNAAAAAVVATLCEVEAATIGDVLRSFPGVEHRLEAVGTVAGVAFVNDSKATNVDSVCYALKSLPGPVHLICGGRHKGAGYDPIIAAGQNRIKGLVLIGEARDMIFEALGRSFPARFADSLEEAVRKAFEDAVPGETVVLSPGCASFDMFDDFEHRGRVFKTAVQALKNNRNSNEKVSR